MSSPEQNGENDRRQGRLPWGWVRMYALVFEFLAYIGVLGYLGWRLDEHRGWQPWGLLIGLMAGTGLGLYRMIRESKRLGL